MRCNAVKQNRERNLRVGLLPSLNPIVTLAFHLTWVAFHWTSLSIILQCNAQDVRWTCAAVCCRYRRGEVRAFAGPRSTRRQPGRIWGHSLWRHSFFYLRTFSATFHCISFYVRTMISLHTMKDVHVVRCCCCLIVVFIVCCCLLCFIVFYLFIFLFYYFFFS